MRLLRLIDGIGVDLTKDIHTNSAPPYAILSHTWSSNNEDEVSYRDIVEGSWKHKVGYKKIEFCAQQARRDGLEYFWVDTCCIDKSNSAEQQEAINSMFRWYGGASRCYVYLSDVFAPDNVEDSHQSQPAWKSTFRKSRWFERGWTLQELLAPHSVEFFSRNGRRLGDKRSLAWEIHDITGIAAQALQGCPLSRFDTVERLKWADKRQTSREEDWAYCLLGIFGVFMPLIYGEGLENAVRRLKEQIATASSGQEGIEDNTLKSWLNLDIVSTQANFEEAMRLRQEGTGSWFLEHDVYQKWLSTENSLFWVYGIPGSGKTVLSTTIIQDLQERMASLEAQTLGVAYFYIDHRDPSKRTFRSLIQAGLDQLMRQCDACTDDLRQLQLRKARAVNESPSLQDYLMLFKAFTMHFKKVFLVVDALDESIEVEDFVNGLVEIITGPQSTTRAQILVTSRHQLALRRLIEPIATLQFCLTTNNGPDISRYIACEIRSRILAKKLQLRNPSLEGVIVDALVKGADGIFALVLFILIIRRRLLWANLQIRHICSLWSDREIKASLNKLPKGLDETYDSVLREIRNKSYDQIDQLKKVLQWLIVARDRVSLPQIAEAVSLRPGDSWLDLDGVATNSEKLIEPLGSLFTVHMELNQPLARFAHKSVEEYLLSERLRDSDLADFHVDINAAHIMVAKTCIHYLSLGKGFTPLRLAAENSHTGVVDVLLKAGADPNIPSASGSTPFYGATRAGCLLAMELLRDANSDIDVETWDQWTPLMEAIENGHIQAVKRLIHWDVKLNITTVDGRGGLKMQHRTKQKSCFPCANGKRRCDRTLPSCTRCIDRGVKCAYPLTRGRASLGVCEVGSADDAAMTLLSPLELQDQDESSVHVLPTDSNPHSDNGIVSRESMPSNSSEPISENLSCLSSQTSLSSAALASRLRWFTPPSTWDVVHHYHPPDTIPSPQVFSEFVRGLGTWLNRFRQEGHNPFIHRQLYPPRAIPDCIQDAYAAIAVAEGANTENENIIDSITFSYVTRLLAQHIPLAGHSLHVLTVKDHLARTQALLIHLLLAITSSSVSRQAKADGFIDTLHRWNVELLSSAAKEFTFAQLFPCTPGLNPDVEQDNNMVSDLHRAFIICESIRRTWLLCSVAIGVYRSLRGDWTVVCGGDIFFTARASLWNAKSSAVWANVACTTDPLFEYSLRGEELVNRGVPAMEVEEFARHLFTLMWGADKVESWVFRTQSPGSEAAA
ncbi:Vegetative incompatibility protein [Paramyrothecium foliicola]|nr:Vegetative incompatibility protein [Paramyrothecium foliicola]